MKTRIAWSFALLSLGACVDTVDTGITEEASSSQNDSGGNALRWPSTTIQYYIDMNGTIADTSQPHCGLATNEALPPDDENDIEAGIALFNAQTPLHFSRIYSNPSSAYGRVIVFTRWDGTSSHGSAPNPAPAGTASDWQACIYFPAGGVSPRTVQHEMGHNMGFEHEQQRWDSPSYVTTNMACVDPTQTGNFAIDSSSSKDTTYGTYDLDSVMQYDSNSLCLDSCKDAAGNCTSPTVLRKYAKPGCNPATDPWQCKWIDKSPGFSQRDLNAYFYKYEPQLGTAQANEGLGGAMAVGDFNGDGLDDLAVGVPGHKGVFYTAGAVYLYRGTEMGLTAWTTLTIDASSGARFGAALAVADTNADGYDDLFVGAPGQVDVATNTANVGAVYQYRGHGAQDDRIPPTYVTTFWESQSGLGGAVEADQFGSSLAVAKLDGSHWFLTIGAPKKDIGGTYKVIDEGTLYALRLGNSAWQRIDETGGYAYDNYGASQVAVDYTDDTTKDLVVGAPQTGTTRGGQVVLLSGGNALAQTGVITDATAETNGRFGAALAVGHLLTSTGARELAIGAPG